MAVSNKIKDILSSDLRLVNSSGTKPLSRLKQSNPSNTTETLSVSDNVSLSKRNELTQQVKALNKLSDASSFTSTAIGAVKALESLLSKAIEVTEKLESAQNSEQKNALKDEAEELLDGIDTVMEAATFNEQSIINSGTTSFSNSLESSANSSFSAFSIVIPNLSISKQNLGIDSLIPTDFTANPSQTKITLEEAQNNLSKSKPGLTAAQLKIENIASTSEFKSAGTIEFNDETFMTKLANEVADSIKSSLSLEQNSLDSNIVENLLTSSRQLPERSKDTVKN